MENQVQAKTAEQLSQQDNKGSRSKIDNEELYEKIDKSFEVFLREVKTNDSSWEKISSDETVTFWKQTGSDDSNGIYKIKFVGNVPYSLDIVCKILFEHRKIWDKVIDQITEIDMLNNKDKSKVLHICTRSPFPLAVSHRDFLHVRTDRAIEKGNRVVLDISTTHSKCPEQPGFVRAHTFVSGGLFESSFVPNLQTKKLDEGCTYSCITQVDFKGYIPVWVVNMIAARTTLDWFYSLKQACDQLVKGQLLAPQ